MTYNMICNDDILRNSRIARIGQRVVNLALTLRMCRPLALLIITGVMMVGALVDPAFAQNQGATLAGNSSNPINAFRTALDIGVWVLLGLGIGGIGWGIYNVMADRAWGRQIVGGACALGFAGIVALVNDVINDQPPSLPQY